MIRMHICETNDSLYNISCGAVPMELRERRRESIALVVFVLLASHSVPHIQQVQHRTGR